MMLLSVAAVDLALPMQTLVLARAGQWRLCEGVPVRASCQCKPGWQGADCSQQGHHQQVGSCDRATTILPTLCRAQQQQRSRLAMLSLDKKLSQQCNHSCLEGRSVRDGDAAGECCNC